MKYKEKERLENSPQKRYSQRKGEAPFMKLEKESLQLPLRRQERKVSCLLL